MLQNQLTPLNDNHSSGQIRVVSELYLRILKGFVESLFLSLYLFILSQPFEEDFQTGVQRHRTKKKERIKARQEG